MAVEFSWQLPVSGDGRYGDAEKKRRGERPSDAHPYSSGVTDPRGTRFNYFDHLHQVARAADLAGFDALRIPHDAQGDESWIVAGYVARGTQHLKLIVEFEAAWGSSVYAAKNAVTFQRYTGGRVAWQISRGGEAAARRQLGDFVGADDINTRIDEFVTVAHGVTRESPFTFKGRFFEVLNGGFQGALGQHQPPQIYLSGASQEDQRLSARIADVHVLDAQPLDTLRTQIKQLQAAAQQQRRKLGFGLRIDLIARETEQEAVFDAQRYWDQTADKGAQPNRHGALWQGLTTATTGAAATLVGSYAQVADALVEYFRAGVDSFHLSAVPHFEEAYRIGEYVLPLVRAKVAPDHRRAA